MPPPLQSAHVRDAPLEVVALQPAAIVDHCWRLPEKLLREAVGGAENEGGSRRCSEEEFHDLLSKIPPGRLVMCMCSGQYVNCVQIGQPIVQGFKLRLV